MVHPWTNGYVFSKNLAERAIQKHRGNIRTIITRPSGVVATLKDPFGGWIDSVAAVGMIGFPMMMSLASSYYLGPTEGSLMMVPADVCSNGVLVAACYAARTPEPEFNIIH